MITLALFLVFLQAPSSSPPQPPTTSAVISKGEVSPEQQLLRMKRIYVDSFGDDAVSKQMQAMMISALSSSGRFVVTENKDKADAILRGIALEKTSQEFHSLNDSAAVGTAVGHQSGNLSGTIHNGTGSISGSSSGGLIAHSIATDDSSASTETVDHARLAVRLVSSDGDVIWASTQESKGAKYKGASADVADKVVKQLLRDIEKIDKPANQKPK